MDYSHKSSKKPVLKFTNAIILFGLISPLLTKLPLPFTLGWLVDLFTHWQFIWLTISVITAAILTWQSRRLRHLFVLSIALSISTLCGIQNLDSADGKPENTFGLVSANLNLGQADLTALKSWLDKTKPDAVVLLEVTEQVANTVDQWQEYKTRQLLPAATPFGVGVLARDTAHVQWRNHNGIPYAEINVRHNGKPLVLFGIHPMPPITADDHQARNELIASLNEKAKETSVIVAGDFNASPWSSAVNIENLSRASTLQPTWLGILPIDMILATKDWVKVIGDVGPDIGSDHKPVFARLISR